MTKADPDGKTHSRAATQIAADRSRPNKARTARRALLAMMALFAVLALPNLIWPMMPHPDEHRYSIAAAQMMETGDWFVPVTETGEIRLKKPPLTYWYLVPGFALLGETLAGAKLLFLASALGVIAMTFALARTLGASHMASLVAGAAIAGHGIYFTTSTQHIPDMPLLLGLSVALWGAVRVLGPEPLLGRDWAALWLGLAWAVLAKGLLALVLAALVGVLLVVRDTTRAHPAQRARLAAFGWALVGIVAAGAWFLWIGVIHPEEMLRQFLGDQVSDKAGFDAGQVMSGLRKTLTDLTLPVLPVLVALGLAGRAQKGMDEPGSAPRRAVLMLWLWCAIVVVLFAFSNQLYERYILPALPAFAVLLALRASRVSPVALARGARRSVRFFLWLPATLAILGSLVAWRFGAPGWSLAAGLAALMAGTLLWRASSRGIAALVALAALVPLIEITRLPVFGAVIQPTSGQIALVAEAPTPGTEQRLVLDDPKLLDDIGLMTGGLIRLHYGATYDPGKHPQVSRIYFLDPAHGPVLKAAGFAVTAYPILPDLNLDWPELRSAFAHADRARLAAEHGKTLYMATLPQ